MYTVHVHTHNIQHLPYSLVNGYKYIIIHDVCVCLCVCVCMFVHASVCVCTCVCSKFCSHTIVVNMLPVLTVFLQRIAAILELVRSLLRRLRRLPLRLILPVRGRGRRRRRETTVLAMARMNN